MTNCLSCGMPMTTQAEHGAGDLKNTWCCHCSHADGSHKSYDEVLAGGIAWIMSDQCLEAGFPRAKTQHEAKARIEANMRQQPAWKDRE